MPLPGGSSDKFGNRYEGRWTVHCMVEIIEERANSIRLEPPGEEGEGVEFWFRKDGQQEFHQVKRQQTSSGRWANADLHARGILSHFLNKLQSQANARCVFISTDRAYQLEELSERAESALNIEEFEGEYLNTEGYKKLFSDLCFYWNNCQPSKAVDFLKRVRVETISERQLSTVIESRLAALIEGDSATVAEILAQLALDRVGHVLTAHDIWHHLESRGFRRRDWANDQHVLAGVNRCNEAYLTPLLRDVIGGVPIPRKEVQEVIELLNSMSQKRAIMLIGDAGIGKSGVMMLLATTVKETGWPMLAFSVDRLKPTLLTVDVGKHQLGLSGSPANVLAAIAQNKKCVLLIDQLDAVSLVSGRHPGFFDCVHQIILEALSHPNMRVVIACRKFDLENDSRLRQLAGHNGIAETIEVAPLDKEIVQGVVEKLNLNAERLAEKQFAILSVPLHLSLLASATNISTTNALAFETIRDLYDSYWKSKQQAIRARRGQGVQWNQVIDCLCDYMSRQQVPFAPEYVVEENDCAEDAALMASEHVLVYDRKRYLFFHESFFDYAYARRFSARGGQLITELLNSEQHLFRRAQVRQILSYERETDFVSHLRYLATIHTLLGHSKIRFHIKSVLFALLAQLENPGKQEWEILETILDEDEELLAQEVWHTLHGSAPWVALLHSLGKFQEWLLDDNNERVNRAVTLLRSVQSILPELVAELIEPIVDKSEAWNDRLIYLMRFAKLSEGRRFFDLFLRLIDHGLLDNVKSFAINGDFWNLIYSLPKENPEWACEVIRHRFNRLLEIGLAEGKTNPFLRGTYQFSFSESGNRVIAASAQGAPLTFVIQLLPFMLRVIFLNLVEDNKSSRQDQVWSYRPYGKPYSIDTVLLQAMETALRLLASEQPRQFLAIAHELSKLDFETVEFLLVRGYSANGSEFADVAVEYLLENSVRFQIGYDSHNYWATRELIEAITPHCSESYLERLEEALLNYYPDDERSKWGYKGKRFGYGQFMLLEGIAPFRRSKRVIKRLREHRRSGKFDIDTINKPPEEIEVRRVPPPIPEAAAARMTDGQWLKAIAHYNQEELMHLPGGRTVGGADSLAGLLRGQTQKEPERFANLLLRFPADTHWLFFNAVLRGVSEANLEVQTLREVVEKCHSIVNRPCGRAIADLISKSSQHNLPEALFEILVWYATKDPNPGPSSPGVVIQDENPNTPNSIFTNGINSVRGRASKAIASLIFSEPERGRYFLPILRKLVKDPSVAVKSCVAEALVATINYDRKTAIDLFITLCKNEESLLATRYVERFFYYTTLTHFDVLESILKKMLESEISEVVTVGSRQICLASLSQERVIPLALTCVSGNEAQQKGAAEVFAANLRDSRFRTFCEESLAKLFDSPYAEVQAAASHCFDRFKDNELGQYEEFVSVFINSVAFGSHYYSLIRVLEDTTAKLPKISLLASKKFLDQFGKNVGDLRTRAAAESDTISILVIRVYSQSEGNEEVQSQCLDLIDLMAQTKVYGLDRTLALFER